jgi:hypothetical protein
MRVFFASLFACVSSQQFGHSLLPQFGFRPGYINLNHGSYGSAPRAVTANQTAWIRQCEENPDGWFRSGVSPITYFDFQDRVR